MRVVITSIEAEFQRYKQMAEAAMEQLPDPQLAQVSGATENSIAIIAWHIGGNLRSRFTDFLGTDGEKPWRDRDTEFLPRQVTRTELLAFWEQGWQALSAALTALTDDDLNRSVMIRGQQLSVIDALHRALAHTTLHVGQIVFIAKALRGPDWRYLTIPPGKSAEYAKALHSENPHKPS